MKWNHVRLLLLLSAVAGLSGSVLGRHKVANESPPISSVLKDGRTTINVTELKTQLNLFPADTLTKEERDGLIFMREEEKLALDVYTVLSAKWGSRPFGNIARAEQTHMDAVKVLLDRFDIPDPAAETKPGEFKNPSLQKLYTDLISSGGVSRIEALKVGALIEDLDLFDLARWLKVATNNDIKLVYSNLERGSRNHLRAFVSNLTRSGATYTPKHISQAEFDEIIATPTERGRGSGVATLDSKPNRSGSRQGFIHNSNGVTKP